MNTEIVDVTCCRRVNSCEVPSRLRFNVFRVISFFFSIFCAASVLAQDANQLSVKVGEADLYPSVTLGYSSIDNIYRVSTESVEGNGVSVKPSVIYVASRRGLELVGGYRGSYESFSESAFNYNDHSLFGSVEAIFTSRKRLEARVELNKDHETLGTGLTLNAAIPNAEQIERFNFNSSIQYTYGAPSARFNLSGGLQADARSYLNRSDITDGRDYTEFTPFGQLSYRLSADTRALLELRLRNLSYDNSVNDRLEAQVLTGLAFKGTAKSGGSVKLGFAQAEYSDDRAVDESILTSNIQLYFAPSSLSRFDIRFQREFNNDEVADPETGQSQTINDFASIQWQKSWSGFVKSSASISYTGKNRECPLVGTQDVKTQADITFIPKRWVQVGLGFSNTSHSADSCAGDDSSNLEYDLQELSVFMTVTL